MKRRDFLKGVALALGVPCVAKAAVGKKQPWIGRTSAVVVPFSPVVVNSADVSSVFTIRLDGKVVAKLEC